MEEAFRLSALNVKVRFSPFASLHFPPSHIPPWKNHQEEECGMISGSLLPVFDHLNLLRGVGRIFPTDRHEASQVGDLFDHVALRRQAMALEITADDGPGATDSSKTMDEGGVVVGNGSI